MAIRVTPNLDDTEQVCAAILRPIKADASARVMLNVPAGSANKLIARVRVYLSRRRKEMDQAGQRRVHFRLRTAVHPETLDGKRTQCITFWKEYTDLHFMNEIYDQVSAAQ